MDENIYNSLTMNQIIELEDRMYKECKSIKIAYLLWCFGAAFGLHRFYLGMYGTGLKAFAASFLSFGLAGIYIAYYDYRNMDSLVMLANQETILNIIKDVKRV